jgi:diacylglycerol kinase family enzyme
MRRLLLVTNPAASNFTGAVYRDVLRILDGPYQVTPVWPGSAAGARAAATAAAGDGYDVVAAMGGDGVVHHVANGLIGSETALGIIPAGTTDVFARILGLPAKPRKAARALIENGDLRSLRTARITADGVDGSFTAHAMFALGAGIDAEVVEEAERRPRGKLHFGGLYFARTALRMLATRFRRRPANLRIEADQHRLDGVGVMVQIHSRYTYLGFKPLRITPDADDDLSVLAVPKAGPWVAARFLPRLAFGRSLDGAAGAEVWTGVTKLSVAADPPVLVQADGELLGRVHAFEVTPASERLLIAG